MDSQHLNAVQSCPFKYDLTFNKNLRSVTKPHFFDEGDILHQMLATYYQGKMDGLSHQLAKEKANDEIPLHIATLDISQVEAQLNVDVTNEYLEAHKFDDMKIVAVEHPFAFLLTEDEEEDLRIVYVGKIDLVTEMPNGEIRPWDHKTSKRRVEPSKLSNQFKGYCRALDVNTITINKIAFIKAEDKFKRYPLSYSENELKRWEANAIWWGKQLDYYFQTGTWPQNETSCDKYSGCDYAALCEADSIEVMNHLAQTIYKITEPWDPTKTLSKKIPLTEVR